MQKLIAALGNDIKPRGKNWVARCRVHNDKDFAMSIKEERDGSVVAHCHACGANGLDLYKELGLDLDELFGGRQLDRGARQYCPSSIRDEYETERWIVRIYEGSEEEKSEDDTARYKKAARRVNEILLKYEI
jgi:hypothetical protein